MAASSHCNTKVYQGGQAQVKKEIGDAYVSKNHRKMGDVNEQWVLYTALMAKVLENKHGSKFLKASDCTK